MVRLQNNFRPNAWELKRTAFRQPERAYWAVNDRLCENPSIHFGVVDPAHRTIEIRQPENPNISRRRETTMSVCNEHSPAVGVNPGLEERAKDWMSKLAADVSQYVGWPCDAAQLNCICLPAKNAVEAVKNDFAHTLGIDTHAVSVPTLRELTMTRRIQVALLSRQNTLIVAQHVGPPQCDALRGAMFRQLVKFAQRQRFPRFFEELDAMLLQMRTLKAPFSETDRGLCSRAFDRLLWAEGHAEYTATRARRRLYPSENEVPVTGVWDWILEFLCRLVDFGTASYDDLHRAVRSFDKMMRGNPVLIEDGFTDPQIAELLSHGQRPYTVVFPYGKERLYRRKLSDMAKYKMYCREMKKEEGPCPEILIDPEVDSIGAGRQLIRLGKKEEGFSILWRTGIAKRNTECLLELAHASRFEPEGRRYVRQAYEAILSINPTDPEAVRFFRMIEEEKQTIPEFRTNFNV